MHWYDRYKISQSQPINWGQFGQSLLKTVGTGGAVMALMIYFNMPQQQAEQIVQFQPQQAEQSLRNMPLQVLQQASQMQQNNAPAQSQPLLQPSVPKPLMQPGLVPLEELSQLIEKHEGREHSVYTDTTGNPTIGVGFNLNRDDAQQLLGGIGADYNAILNRRQALNDQQINALLQMTINEATKSAQQFIPDLAQQPKPIQMVLVDMAFNLGDRGLKQFSKLKTAIENKDYATAAQEMINSRWYSQVKGRGEELVKMMQQAAQSQNLQPVQTGPTPQ